MMNHPQIDETIKYLVSKENLPYTLNILQQGKEIRRRAISDFWRSVRETLPGSAPKGLPRQQLRWRIWPDEGKLDGRDVGLYCYQARFAGQPEVLSYYVNHYNGPSVFQTYFGLSWEDEQPNRSSLWRLPAVKNLVQYLSDNGFRQTRWSVGWRYIHDNETLDSFLLKYARSADEIHRQLQESFWPLVRETFAMTMKANEAIRRAK
ncbi:MAG: hypothetical protein NT154_19375 [Verrucomicrobia bacterium]|nr:hypothetical protein [Verrucomicrobiota bacterium]